MTQPRLIALDAVRGLSALAVAAGHLRLVMMCDYGEIPHPTLLQTAFFILTGLASPAVMVFFVLSGYLVGGSMLKAGPRFDFGDYLRARLVRLWIVLIPALVWTLAIDTITERVVPGSVQGANFPRWTSGPLPGAYSSSFVTFVGNVAFLNPKYVESYGSNGPLWSLACEFWYYLLFPLLARAVGRLGSRPPWHWRIVYFALAVAILALLSKSMAWGFLVWLMGVAAAAVQQQLPKPLHRRWLIPAGLLFALALVATKLDHFGWLLPIPSRFLVGLGFAVLVVPLAGITAAPRVVRFAATALAELSYTFYLVHFPLTLLIGVAVYRDRERTATPADLLEYAGWFALLLAVSVPIWWLFERNTPRVRNTLRRLWPPSSDGRR